MADDPVPDAPEGQRHGQDDGAFVGGVLRPPRPVTLGRRRSDRLLAYSAVILMASMLVFILYTSWQQGESAKDRERAETARSQIIDRLECLAGHTSSFEDAMGQYLLAQQSRDADKDPKIAAALEQLRAMQELRGDERPKPAAACAQAQLTPTTR